MLAACAYKMLRFPGPRPRIDMLLGLGIELAELLRETLLALGHLLSFALELLTLDDLCQI